MRRELLFGLVPRVHASAAVALSASDPCAPDPACANLLRENAMHSSDLHRSLPSLFSELVFGAPEAGAFVLNPRDPGILASLDRLSADEASTVVGNASVAAHVRHLEYGLSLMNRWAAGENPFEDANWAAAWEQPRVSFEEWASLRASLAQTCEAWRATLRANREVAGVELDGIIGSIIHLAYHLGAIRQMNPALRGPSARD